jgi:hypothetical protein
MHIWIIKEKWKKKSRTIKKKKKELKASEMSSTASHGNKRKNINNDNNLQKNNFSLFPLNSLYDSKNRFTNVISQSKQTKFSLEF